MMTSDLFLFDFDFNFDFVAPPVEVEAKTPASGVSLLEGLGTGGRIVDF